MSGSRRAHTPRTPNPDTSTGTDHVRGHNDAPTSTHNQTRAHETWTQAQNSLLKSRTYKGTGRCMSPDQIHKDPQTRDARVRTKTPEAPAHTHGPRSQPLSPGSPLLGPGSPLWPSPGRQAAAADALGPGKVEGPLPRPWVQHRPLAGWNCEVGVGGGSCPSPSARTPLSARGPAPTWKPAPQPPRHAHPGGPIAGPLAGAFLSAARPAPRPPGPPAPARRWALPRPPRAQWWLWPAAGRFRECRQSAGLSRRVPRSAPRPPAEPLPSPGSTIGSVSKVRTQLPPTPVGLAPSFLHPGSLPPSAERLSHLSRWPQGREHLEVAGVCVCVCVCVVCVCVCVERERERGRERKRLGGEGSLFSSSSPRFLKRVTEVQRR